MKRSKRLKELEVRVDALTVMTETLLGIVYEILDKNTNKPDLDSGKWYKDRS